MLAWGNLRCIPVSLFLAAMLLTLHDSWFASLPFLYVVAGGQAVYLVAKALAGQGAGLTPKVVVLVMLHTDGPPIYENIACMVHMLWKKVFLNQFMNMVA